MKTIALALALGLGFARAEGARPDALVALEQDPSPAAAERLAAMYRQVRDPYARIWILDTLYERVRRHQDVEALKLLAQASSDKNPDVRRKAISGLEAVQYLQPGPGLESWRSEVERIAEKAGRDSLPGVRSAGRELETSMKTWDERQDSAAPRPEASSESASSWSLGAVSQIFIWVVSLQLIGYAWHKMGMSVLAQLGPAGEGVLSTIGEFQKKPSLLAFPVINALLLLPFLGLCLAWALVDAATPSSLDPRMFHLGVVAVGLYVVSGLACLFPALLVVGKRPAGLKSAARQTFGFLKLIQAALILWPVEPLLRTIGGRRGKRSPWIWMARTGTPFAAMLVGRQMAEKGASLFSALSLAAKSFPAADQEPGAEFWGRAPFQASFVLWCLASPLLFSLSLLPALWIGFKPTEMFGLWFLSDAQFVVGFGWWAGILLSVSALGQLMILGAIRGTQLTPGDERA